MTDLVDPMIDRPQPPGIGGPGATRGPRVDGGNRELVTLRSLVTIYHRLSAVALQNAEVAAITDLLASQVGVTAFVFSESLDVVAASTPPGTDGDATTIADGLRSLPSAVRVIRAVGRTRRAVRSPHPAAGGWIVAAPVVVGTEVAAYLVTTEAPEGNTDEATSLLVTEHAATMCGIVIGRDRAVVAAASRVREDLLEGLLFARSGDDAELERWADHLGIQPAPRAAGVMVVSDGHRPSLAALVERARSAGAPSMPRTRW